MLRTRVGYCGGTKEKPTYLSMGDHTEAVAIDFDPSVTSYGDLLERFWDGHYCGSNVSSRQYMYAVFYQNDEQRRLAEESRAKAAARQGIAVEDVKTAILPAGRFTYAENYHQKYYLTRHGEVRDFLRRIYPTSKALADSTVATRLNAYLGSGFDKDPARLAAEIESYGLPDKVTRYVLRTAGPAKRAQ